MIPLRLPHWGQLRFGAAERLALIRWATGAYALIYLIPRRGMFESIARNDPSLFDPVGLAHLLGGPVAPGAMDALYLATVALAVAFTLGAWFRVVGPTFALMLLALLSYRNSWSMVLHMHNGLVVHVALLGLARSAEAWSIDALRRGHPAQSRPAHEAAITWLAVATCVPYFLSGLAKIMGPEGWAWAGGESLRDQIAVNALRYHVLVEGATAELFSALAEQGWLFAFMGIITLILELGAPLALAHPRVGAAWALLTWAMHWGIFSIMGIVFRHQMWGVFFLPILLRAFRGQPAPSSPEDSVPHHTASSASGVGPLRSPAS